MTNFATQKEAQLQGIECGFYKASDGKRADYEKPMQTPDASGQHVLKSMEPVNENPKSANTGSFLSDKK
jgi:hypothetical protein